MLACSKHASSILRAMLRAWSRSRSRTKQAEQEQDQEQSSLTSFERNPLAARAGWLRVVEGSVQYALERGLTVEDAGEEFEAFLDHRFKTPKTKWDLAWKAWVRKAVQIRGLGSGRRTQPQTAAQRSMETAEEFGREAGVL